MKSLIIFHFITDFIYLSLTWKANFSETFSFFYRGVLNKVMIVIHGTRTKNKIDLMKENSQSRWYPAETKWKYTDDPDLLETRISAA